MANNATSDLFAGIQYISEGFSLAFMKKVRLHILVPILINVVLFAGMSFFLFYQLNSWLSNTSLSIMLPNWVGFLQPVMDFILGAAETLLWILALVIMLLFTTSTFTSITNIIAAPFNGFLAERIEAHHRPLDYPSLTISQLIGRTIKRELTKLKYWLSRLILLFLLTLFLSLIPLINTLSPIIWFCFSGWMLSIQYIDFAADNNGLDFNEMLARLHQHKLPVLSFGLTVMGLTLLPFINLIIVPVAICGATAFWVKILDPNNSTHAPNLENMSQA